MPKKLKTSKSASKRYRFTKTGKVFHRAPNMNHFNAKDSGSMRRDKRGEREVQPNDTRELKFLLPYK